MKAKTFQINWHDNLAVFSVDFDPSRPGRFATAGGDSNVRLWRLMESSNGNVSVNFVAELARHSAAVNVVRFSPADSLLASSGDDGTIIVWKQSQAASGSLENASVAGAEETWKAVSLLRGSLADIYDISWSADGRFIISGSVDNTARIWDVKQAKCIHCIADHSNYIQGVAWDPKGHFFATQSSDRAVNIYEWTVKTLNTTKKSLLVKHSRLEDKSTGDGPSKPHSLSGQTGGPQYVRLYHSETLTSFFRRLCFTPDGSVLLTPAGIHRVHDSSTTKSGSSADEQTQNAVYIYARDRLAEAPVAMLSGFQKPAIAIRCAPHRFCKRPPASSGKPSSEWLGLPYRLVFAVATQDAVILYDSQQHEPLAYLANFHYATLTDLSWSPNGRHLLMTSSDGYCSVVIFDEGELGEIYGQPISTSVTTQVEPVKPAAPSTPKPVSGMVKVEATPSEIANPVTTTKTGKKRIQPTLISSIN
ncbi:WD40-repeat-containing domain protein [Dimargaris cristalligena]|uniref:WD40-repeat-containing domain protein n=1 Tax=Dimargaris cristalligena TaxID=215637 RepID=A0A4P9ZVV7_9FUNG|nr:WD40-repeat-containing domain protein [Dimargaris cristalligena]|eukprot:RKP37081.1 WD40-repeat-containing domain protein [Dimargaris cristalligena]